MADRKIYIDEILRIAKAHHLEEPTSSYDAFNRALQWWWCQKFNRPIKDPLLKSYTRDELFYEFMRYFYTQPDKDPRKELEAKEVKVEDEAWIRKMLAEEGLMLAKEAETQPKVADPAPEQTLPEVPEFSTRFDSDPNGTG